MTSLRQKFPDLSAIIPVYAVIAFPIFGWTIVVWLWKLPYWLNFLTAGEIGSIFAYAMATALFESLVLIGLFLLLSFLLPKRFLRDQFIVRGTWLALGLTIAVLGNGVWRNFLGFSYMDFSLAPWTLISLVAVCLITFAAPRLRIMARLAEWLSDQLIVFLYVLMPISLLSIVVILVRNIL